ncbi:MAG: tRNA pseudouridine(13) synthase TruD [Methanobacteriota archaeon]|nr:MAG: tRNA pseudouridine(13) synthase TruD [Euryarchaeota archaeon]
MDETVVGISGYFTSAQGLGGRIKASAEDFVVDEVSMDLPRSETGPYTAARIRTRNWETNRLVRELARHLHISRKRISFAGTKDRRAVTTQLFEFDGLPDLLEGLHMKDVEVLEAFRTDKKLEIGDLLGNRFRVVVREIPFTKAEIEARAGAVARELRMAGGFPNFFGIQRFGSVRPITHVVGRHLVRGEIKDAVMAYVAHPIEGEDPESFAVREDLESTGDYAAALRGFPKEWGFEKAILNRLATHPEDFAGALQQLPPNLLILFVHGYQSYLFNRILSERMREGLPVHEPVEGDVVLAARPDGRPDREREIPVDAGNLEKATAQCRAGKAFVSGVLFGSESEFAAGRPGEIEERVVGSEGLRREDFVIPAIPRLSSKGTRRELLAPLRDLEWEAGEGTLEMRFTLTPGCYGTSLLREFMKVPVA